MKTDLTTTGSYAQSKTLGQKAQVPQPPVPGSKEMKTSPAKPPAPASPDYKVDLSPKLPSALPDLPLATPKAEVPKAAPVKEEKKAEASEAVKQRDGTVKKPAIFFIKGMDVFSSPSKSEGGYRGVGKIAEAIEGSRLYGWDQKDEIIKEIKKIHADYPVILLGHSLGGDTAVEVAQELDSLEHRFRPVDLLITMDAIGFGHDIIPQNVKKHLNVFGENSWPLNDGPHVARREEKTQVRNILSNLDHTELDDDSEIQFEVVSTIQETLGRFKKNSPGG